MNAYELADELKLFWHTENDNLFEIAANMLRQQADRIAELEKGAEPVAWLINGKLFEEYFRTSELDKIIPLYTTPQTKPLSDEEIGHLWETIYDHGNGKYQGDDSKNQRKIAFEILEKLK